MDAIEKLGGKVVSVTTDGFITNLPHLEGKISTNYLFSEYKKIREVLSGDDTGLEVKNEGRGILAWTTRGQLGFESKIIATTGFQHNVYSIDDRLKVFTETFKSETKCVEFIQSRLRSAKDIYTRGGHVTMVYNDQQFRMHFDNKRLLVASPGEIEEQLLDSKPLMHIKHGENLRFISKLTKISQYSKFSSSGVTSRYKKSDELAITNFIKALVSEPPLFKLHRVGLEKYSDIIDYLKAFNPSINISKNRIAYLKSKSVNWRSVPRISKSDEFIKYIKLKFKDFDENSFFREK